MEKAAYSSWLAAVKKAFNSPTKGSPKKSCSRREEHVLERENEEEENLKLEKRRWIFRKHTSQTQQCEGTASINAKKTHVDSMDEQRHAIAIAEDSAAAAEAAVATAKSTVISVQAKGPSYLVREHYAALIIQTAFRGYLARRASCALKGIVKLQALVRGHIVRNQAKTTLEFMQALMQVQAKMYHQCSRHSNDQMRKSMYAETNNLWDKYKDIHQRKPASADGIKFPGQWEVQSCTIGDMEYVLQNGKEAASYREDVIADALSQKMRRFDQNHYTKDQKEETDNTEWLEQWMERKQFKKNEDGKQFKKNEDGLIAHRRDSIKNVDAESLVPHLGTPSKFQRSQHQDPENRRHSLHIASPAYKTHYSLSHQSPMTPSLSSTRPLQVQSASPRCLKGCRSNSTTSTPRLRLNCPSGNSSYQYQTGARTMTPNYMAATESAKARARTQSIPRHRSVTSDRERVSSVKKRLAYPNPEPQYQGSIYADYNCVSQNLRSPSFRSVQVGMYGVERGTLCSYTESSGGEHSPASTSHIRRWLS